jgi:hypothetical protein
MSLLRPLPPGASHPVNDNGMEFLPPFVQARLRYLADIFDWHPDEEGEETFFTYYEVRGRLSDGHYTLTPEKSVAPNINIWIAGDDDCHRSLFVGGSFCWICPDSHYLFFDEIDPALLPEKPDRDIWWCINYEEDIKVIKIYVFSAEEEEITEEFPDGV